MATSPREAGVAVCVDARVGVDPVAYITAAGKRCKPDVLDLAKPWPCSILGFAGMPCRPAALCPCSVAPAHFHAFARARVAKVPAAKIAAAVVISVRLFMKILLNARAFVLASGYS